MAAETGEVLRVLGMRGANRPYLIAGIACVVLAVALALPRLAYAFYHETTDDAFVDAQPAVVGVSVAGIVSEIRVVPGSRVRRGDIVGRIDKATLQLDVDEARADLSLAVDSEQEAHHNAGLAATLFDADASAGTLRVSRANIEVDNARTAVQAKQDDIRASGALVAEAREQLNQAQTNVQPAMVRFAVARSNFARAEKLGRNGLIPDAQYQAARQELSSAAAAAKNALSEVVLARANLTLADAEHRAQRRALSRAVDDFQSTTYEPPLQNAQNSRNTIEGVLAARSVERQKADAVQLARVRLHRALRDLSATVLRAPSDGLVAQIDAHPGQMLQAGDVIMKIMPLSRMYITANFKETQLRRIHLNAFADIHIDSYPTAVITGHVATLGAASQSAVSIAQEAQFGLNFVKSTQRIPITIEIDAIRGINASDLHPGMSAEVSVRS